MRASKKIFCIIAVIFTLLLDTSLIPYTGLNTSYCPRLCLITVIMIASMAGKTQGLIFGTLAGLLLGFTVYTPTGLTLIMYVCCGFIAGFWGRIVPHALITIVPVLASLVLWECVSAVYYYFSCGSLPLFMLVNASIRIGVSFLTAQLFYFPFNRVLGLKRRQPAKRTAH